MYIHSWEGDWLCRPCVYAVAQENGWDESTSEIEEAQQKEKVARMERDAKIRRMLAQTRTTYGIKIAEDQGELFE